MSNTTLTVLAEVRAENKRLRDLNAELLAALKGALAVHGDHYSWGPAAVAAITKANKDHGQSP